MGRRERLPLYLDLVQQGPEIHAEDPDVLPVQKNHAVMMVALDHLGQRRDGRPLRDHQPVLHRDGKLESLEPVAADLGVDHHTPVLLVELLIQPLIHTREHLPERLDVVGAAVALQLFELRALLAQEYRVGALVVRVDGHVEEK